MSAGAPQMSFIDYDERYPAAFSQLVERIHTALPDVLVDHVGSTAVAGLGGRGVLDVVVVCPVPEQEHAVDVLHREGLTDSQFAWIKPMLTGIVEYDGHRFPIVAYLLDADHPLRHGLLATRDRLRGDPGEAERYAAVKHQALATGQTTPWAYQQAKTPYLQALTRHTSG